MLNRPIGELKSKATVYCSICGCEHTRKVNAFFYENTSEAIKTAREQLTSKGKKEYTCRICKNIQKN